MSLAFQEALHKVKNLNHKIQNFTVLTEGNGVNFRYTGSYPYNVKRALKLSAATYTLYYICIDICAQTCNHACVYVNGST